MDESKDDLGSMNEAGRVIDSLFEYVVHTCL